MNLLKKYKQHTSVKVTFLSKLWPTVNLLFYMDPIDKDIYLVSKTKENLWLTIFVVKSIFQHLFNRW